MNAIHFGPFVLPVQRAALLGGVVVLYLPGEGSYILYKAGSVW